MHRKSTSKLFPFDPEIERTLFRLKKVKANNTKMEDLFNDKFGEGHLDQNEIPGIWEPTLGDYWRPMMSEDYSGIWH